MENKKAASKISSCFKCIIRARNDLTTAGSSLAMENYGHSAGSASALLGLFAFVIGAIVAPLVGLGGENAAVPMGIVIAVTEVGAILCYMILRPRISSGGAG